MSSLLIIALCIGLSALAFYFSWSISLGIYLRSICHIRQAKDCVALTFDDGVDECLTPQLLDILDSYNAKATFFIVGNKAQQYPHIVRDISNRGHSIGNHSMYHRGNFPARWANVIYNEIVQCSEALEEIVGYKIKYFRPPFGVTNPMLGSAVRRSQLISIGWSIRSYDTLGHEIERVERRVCKAIRGGDIVLLHDNRQGVLELTERILSFLNSKNYRAVSIEELLKE